MRRHATAVRLVSWSLVAWLAAGCSGGADGTDVADVADVPVPTSPSITVVAEERVEPDANEVVVSELGPVVVSVELDGDGLDARLAVDIDPEAVAELDPFGRFASCSGLRSSIGAYSLVVSDPTGDVSSFSALTIDPITGPGTYDADVRIELGGGVVRRGTGTLTLEPGLRTGSLLAFDAEGARMAGSFECRGVAGTPEPLAGRADREDALDTVELLALLERGDAQRVVGLAVDATQVAAECRGAVGGAGPTVVRVDGDESIGAVTTFELTDGTRSTVRLRIGGASYAIDDATVRLDDAGTAGTFAGTSPDGVSIDGAFRCT